MTVIVNGKPIVIAEGTGIDDLIKSLDLNSERVAVEVNRQLIRRANWDSTTISEGDRVEIVHFVGGGSS